MKFEKIVDSRYGVPITFYKVTFEAGDPGVLKCPACHQPGVYWGEPDGVGLYHHEQLIPFWEGVDPMKLYDEMRHYFGCSCGMVRCEVRS